VTGILKRIRNFKPIFDATVVANTIAIIALTMSAISLWQTVNPGYVSVSPPAFRVGMTRALISGNQGDKILLGLVFYNSGNSFKVVKEVKLRICEKDQNCDLSGSTGFFRLKAEGTFEKLLNVPLDESPRNIEGYSRTTAFSLEKDNSYSTNFLFFLEGGWGGQEGDPTLFFLEKGRSYKGQVIVDLWDGGKTNTVRSPLFCLILGDEDGEDPAKAIETLNLSPRVTESLENGCQRG
jgi:hypothetical protein